ncbi:MAG: hypothetical protein Q4D44_05485 [Eubacteriales bacterium]|nr:hypothetical protein [Eubacteriales bacterium]
MNDKKIPSVFPDEVPFGIDKEIKHGTIVDVVNNEINAPAATNPATPVDTQSINTEMAKAYQQKESNNQ